MILITPELRALANLLYSGGMTDLQRHATHNQKSHGNRKGRPNNVPGKTGLAKAAGNTRVGTNTAHLGDEVELTDRRLGGGAGTKGRVTSVAEFGTNVDIRLSDGKTLHGVHKSAIKVTRPGADFEKEDRARLDAEERQARENTRKMREARKAADAAKTPEKPSEIRDIAEDKPAARKTGTKRAPDAQHDALEAAARGVAELAGQFKSPYTKDLGIKDSTVNALKKKGLIEDQYISFGRLGRTVKLTDKGHDYLADVRGDARHAEMNAQIKATEAKIRENEAYHADLSNGSAGRMLALREAQQLTAQLARLRIDRDKHAGKGSAADAAKTPEKPSEIRDIAKEAPAARKEFSKRELADILGDDHRYPLEHRAVLVKAGATPEQADEILKDLGVDAGNEFGAGKRLGGALSTAAYFEERDAAEAAKRARLRAATPRAYSQLLDEDNPAKLTHKPSHDVVSAMRQHGWVLADLGPGGSPVFESPDGSRRIPMHPAYREGQNPTFYDAKHNKLSYKRARQFVTGEWSPG